MSSMALNQVAKCLKSSGIWQLRPHIQLFVLESPVSSCNLRTFSFNGTILRCVLEHSPCVTLKPCSIPKSLATFSHLNLSKWLCKHLKGKATTQWCAGSRGRVFPFGHTLSLTATSFYKTCSSEISKGNLDVNPCICSQAQKFTGGQNIKQCTAYFSHHFASRSRLNSEEVMWAEEEGHVDDLGRVGRSIICLRKSFRKSLITQHKRCWRETMPTM